MLARIRFRDKLIAMALAFTLPIGILLYLMVAGINYDIRFATLETIGNAYQRPLETLMFQVSQSRILAYRIASESQDPSLESKQQELSAQITESFKALEEAHQTYSIDLQATDEGLKHRDRYEYRPEALQSLWQQLSFDSNTLSLEEQDALYAEILTGLQELITHSGDTSNLILDPDLDSYYLMDVTLLALPQMQNRLQEMTIYGLKTLNGTEISQDQRFQMQVYSRLLEESDLQRIQSSLQTAINEDGNFYGIQPSLTENIPPKLDNTNTAITDLISYNHLAAQLDKDETEIDEFLETAEAALVESYDLWFVTVDELDSLLQIRIQNYVNQRRYYLALTFLAVILSCLLAYGVFRSISKTMQTLADNTTQLAEEELPRLIQVVQAIAKGDLSQKIALQTHAVQVQSNDVIGQVASSHNRTLEAMVALADSQNSMVDKLRTLVSQISQDSAILNNAAGELSQIAQQTGLSSQHVAATIQKIMGNKIEKNQSNQYSIASLTQAIQAISNGAAEQATAATTAANITSTITGAIKQLDNNVKEVEQESSNAAQLASDGMDKVQETISGIENINEKVSYSTQKVQEMGQHSNQIGIIVETIDNIASQTNLLALNAAIEAARAGEHGRGFAVVADEILKLAEQSQVAAHEIVALVNAIQTSVLDAIQAMEESTSEVENGTQRASQSGTALEKILASVEMVDQQIKEASTAAAQVDSVLTELVSSVDSVSLIVEENTAATEEMGAMSIEVAEQVESVSEATKQMSSQMQTVSDSSVSLDNLANRLQNAVEQFKL